MATTKNGLTIQNDAASELSGLRDQMVQEQAMYRELHKLKSKYNKIEELERKQALEGLNRIEKGQLTKLRKSVQEGINKNTHLQQKSLKTISNLQKELSGKQRAAEEAYIVSREERELRSKIRIAELDKQNAEVLNKINALRAKTDEMRNAEAVLRQSKLIQNLEETNDSIKVINNKSDEERKIESALKVAKLNLDLANTEDATKALLNKSDEQRQAESTLRIAKLKQSTAETVDKIEALQNKSDEERQAESALNLSKLDLELEATLDKIKINDINKEERREKEAALRVAKLKETLQAKEDTLWALQNRSQEQKDAETELRIAELRISLQQTVNSIEVEQAKTLTEIRLGAEQEVANERLEIAKAGTAAVQEAEREAAEAKMLEDEKRRLAEAKQKVKESDQENKDEQKRELKRINAQQKAIEKIEKQNKAKKRKEETQRVQDLQNSIFGKSTDDNPLTLKDRWEGIKNIAKNEDGEYNAGAAIGNSMKMLGNLAEKLEGTMEEIAAVKAPVDTRLQGSQINSGGWDQINKDFTKFAGATPFFKRSDLTKNLQNLVGQGISYNVEQRAFLETIKDKIATTFNTTNGTLLRLVRIQQQDTTAARLGMESALTAFLNNMYETSEYMQGIAESVRGNLAEALSLMEAKTAVGFEHTVQKWMGSMYSVGMSEGAVNSIATALGDIAAGKIDSLGGDGAGNLVVMAANQAGISIADILADGMTDDEANNLLATAVEYLADMYNQNQDSKVVQQQIAGVFGVAASDLKAAVNLAKDSKTVDAIFKTVTSYDSNLDRLYEMSSTMGKRLSTAEKMSNMWDNMQYSMAAGMANNPALYSIYKIGKLMGDTGADINIPFINAMGFGLDLNASVSELMRGGAMAGGILSSLGQMFSGGGGLNMKSTLKKMKMDTALSTGYADEGANLTKTLKAAGIKLDNNRTRTSASDINIEGSSILNLLELVGGGNDINKKESGVGGDTSQSGSVTAGNSSSDDISSTTLSDASKDGNNQLAEAKEDEENKVDIEDVNENVVKIYELLADVADGNASLMVRLSLDSQFTGLN